MRLKYYSGACYVISLNDINPNNKNSEKEKKSMFKHNLFKIETNPDITSQTSFSFIFVLAFLYSKH